MRKRLFFWEAGGFLFVSAVGTLLHFLCDWTGGSTLAAAFSGVNESTWEHMKIFFFPMFLWSLVQLCFLGRNYPNFPAARLVSTLTGLTLIPVLFYTYGGVLGYLVDWVNISIFYVAALIAYWVDFRLLRRGRLNAPWLQLVAFALMWALAFVFVWCTFHPPQLGLWRDPLTGLTGIQ